MKRLMKVYGKWYGKYIGEVVRRIYLSNLFESWNYFIFVNLSSCFYKFEFVFNYLLMF